MAGRLAFGTCIYLTSYIAISRLILPIIYIFTLLVSTLQIYKGDISGVYIFFSDPKLTNFGFSLKLSK
jgi:hypothetical protein